MSVEPLSLKGIARELVRSKSGLIGVLLLAFVLAVSIVAVMYTPFDIARAWNDPTFWVENPKLAAPEWVDQFTGRRYPRTLVVNNFIRSEFYLERVGLKYLNLEAQIPYDYDGFPSDLILFLRFSYGDKRPLLTVKFTRPDGDSIVLFRGVVDSPNLNLYFSSEMKVEEALREYVMAAGGNPRFIRVQQVLFAEKSSEMWKPESAKVLKGVYTLRMELVGHRPEDTFDGKFIIYGTVHGLAGTDEKRRDIMVAVFWGAPIAVSFGLAAALATTFSAGIFGAISAWYGKRVDEIIQRLTDVYLVIPFLAMLVVISVVYRLTIWALLIVVIALSILGGLTKTTRSMTMQIMTEQYIESAVAYGASRRRILFLYILPRLLPYMLASIVLSVPAYVFLEAGLAILGLGDPAMPTWGKVIADAHAGGAAVHGFWWWIFIPAAMIIITAVSFGLMGYALDKIVNPRLRER